MAQSEDSPVAMKLKKICLKTPVGEEQAAQAVLDPALGKTKFHVLLSTLVVSEHNITRFMQDVHIIRGVPK